jgi:hypothetical protein
MTLIWQQQGLEDRLKPAIIDEFSYTKVQDVVTKWRKAPEREPGKRPVSVAVSA